MLQDVFQTPPVTLTGDEVQGTEDAQAVSLVVGGIKVITVGFPGTVAAACALRW